MMASRFAESKASKPRGKGWGMEAEISAAGVDLTGTALAALHGPDGWTIVRAHRDGYAVIAVSGQWLKVIKVLPTLERARGYNFALHR